MDETITVALRKPVQIGEGAKAISYDHIDLREPTAGELARADTAGGNVAMVIALISLVSGTPKSAVEKLCQRDFQEAADFFGQFAPASSPMPEASLDSPADSPNRSPT